MRLDIEVWLRGNDFATNELVDVPAPEPPGWRDEDVRRILEELLRAIERARHPATPPDRPVALRGFSWIVTPYEGRGVLISVEIQLGAAAAGPFAVDERELDAAIKRVLAASGDGQPGGSTPVH